MAVLFSSWKQNTTGVCKKRKGLFSFIKWGCKNISCIQAQRITMALGLLNLGQKSRIPVSQRQGWFVVQVEKFHAYLCVMAAHSSTTIGGITVVFNLIVPGGDGSLHRKYRERASPDVFSNRGKPGVSLPWLFEVRVMFKLASLRPSFCSLRQIWIPSLQDKDKRKWLGYLSKAVMRSSFWSSWDSEVYMPWASLVFASAETILPGKLAYKFVSTGNFVTC